MTKNYIFSYFDTLLSFYYLSSSWSTMGNTQSVEQGSNRQSSRNDNSQSFNPLSYLSNTPDTIIFSGIVSSLKNITLTEGLGAFIISLLKCKISIGGILLTKWMTSNPADALSILRKLVWNVCKILFYSNTKYYLMNNTDSTIISYMKNNPEKYYRGLPVYFEENDIEFFLYTFRVLHFDFIPTITVEYNKRQEMMMTIKRYNKTNIYNVVPDTPTTTICSPIALREIYQSKNVLDTVKIMTTAIEKMRPECGPKTRLLLVNGKPGLGKSTVIFSLSKTTYFHTIHNINMNSFSLVDFSFLVENIMRESKQSTETVAYIVDELDIYISRRVDKIVETIKQKNGSSTKHDVVIDIDGIRRNVKLDILNTIRQLYDDLSVLHNRIVIFLSNNFHFLFEGFDPETTKNNKSLIDRIVTVEFSAYDKYDTIGFIEHECGQGSLCDYLNVPHNIQIAPRDLSTIIIQSGYNISIINKKLKEYQSKGKIVNYLMDKINADKNSESDKSDESDTSEKMTSIETSVMENTPSQKVSGKTKSSVSSVSSTSSSSGMAPYEIKNCINTIFNESTIVHGVNYGKNKKCQYDDIVNYLISKLAGENKSFIISSTKMHIIKKLREECNYPIDKCPFDGIDSVVIDNQNFSVCRICWYNCGIKCALNPYIDILLSNGNVTQENYNKIKHCCNNERDIGVNVGSRNDFVFICEDCNKNIMNNSKLVKCDLERIIGTIDDCHSLLDKNNKGSCFDIVIDNKIDMMLCVDCFGLDNHKIYRCYECSDNYDSDDFNKEFTDLTLCYKDTDVNMKKELWICKDHLSDKYKINENVKGYDKFCEYYDKDS